MERAAQIVLAVCVMLLCYVCFMHAVKMLLERW